MKRLLLILALSMFACGAAKDFTAPMPTFSINSLNTIVAGTANAASTQTAIFTTPNSTPTFFTETPTPTNIATVTPAIIFNPYEKYTVAYLRSRTYGGGLELVKTVRQEKNFTTYLAQYASDGLSIYALVSIPNNAKIYPVIVTVHGYIPAKEYDLYQDGERIDNALIREGFIVIHPAMRNYPPSDNGDNLFRVGQAIDILNLIAIIKTQSGQPGLLENADPNRIGLEGSSTGGGVALRVLTVSADIKATVLYSSISGDERRNVPFFQTFANDPQFGGEPAASENILAEISPSSYYSFITAPILLAQGIDDRTIPLEWGEETCAQLKAANVNATCNFYKKAKHTFSGENFDVFISRAIAFYRMYLY